MSNILKAKQEVLDSAKNAFQSKLFAGTSGNLSVYLPEEKVVVITPSNVRYETMTIDDIVVIDIDGNVIEGKHKPSSEHRMHCSMYRGLDDVFAVVHTHSPYATGFAVNNQPIPLILIEMIPFLGGSVPVAPLQLPGSLDLGLGIIKAMVGKNCCLMANHGVLTIGKTLAQAYVRAEYVEDAAKICGLAKITGEIVTIPADMEKLMRNG